MSTLVREVRTVPCPVCYHALTCLVISSQSYEETDRARFYRLSLRHLIPLEEACEHLEDVFIRVREGFDNE